MSEPEWMCGDYPTDAALERIKGWDISKQEDISALWEFVRGLWIYEDRIAPCASGEWPFDDCDWYASTGGWSGHEDVIDALRSNHMFWLLCWRASRAGGHFWFKVEGRIK